MRIEKFVLNKEKKTDVTAYLGENYRVIGKRKKSPAVLICPGGGFFSLSEREGEPVAIAFLKEGIQAFVLHYTIANPEEGIVNVMEEGLADCAQAISLIQSHAEEFGIDSTQIIMLGFSAGAYLTAMYSNRYHEKWLQDKVNTGGELCKLKAAVLCYPACDIELICAYKDSPTCEEGIRRTLEKVNLSLCGEGNPSIEMQKKYSPVNYINADTCPTFIWHTSDDELVSVGNSLSYAGALSKKGIAYEMHIFQSGVHGMSLCSEYTAAKAEEINSHCAVWFELLLRWLCIK